MNQIRISYGSGNKSGMEMGFRAQTEGQDRITEEVKIKKQ